MQLREALAQAAGKHCSAADPKAGQAEFNVEHHKDAEKREPEADVAISEMPDRPEHTGAVRMQVPIPNNMAPGTR